MQDALVFPRRVERDEIERRLASSAGLTGAEGLAIYQRGYFLRIASCMREQFPALCHALGEALFNDFVADYIRERPPESHTLYDLGRRFPAWLEESRPDRDLPPAERETWIDFMVDLARFERQVFAMFDAPGHEGEAVRRSGHARCAAAPAALLRAGRLSLPRARLLSCGPPRPADAAAARPGELRRAGANRLCDPHHPIRANRTTSS